MKNQLDWIVAGVSWFLALVAVIVFWQTRRQITKPAPPATVNTAPVAYPAADVKWAAALPNGGSSKNPGGGGGGATASFGGPGGPGGGGGGGRQPRGAARPGG